jgi:hypothetical protein
MDGDGRGGRGVRVNDARPPPTAPYPLARGWIGPALPCFLLLGLWAEFSAEIKIFYFFVSFF